MRRRVRYDWPMPNLDQRGAVSKSVIFGGIAVIAVLAAIAVLLSRGDDSGDGIVGTVTVEGTPLAIFPESRSQTAPPPADTEIGKIAPRVAGFDFTEAPQEIAADGKSKVVFVLAHWCENCQAELPRIVQAMNGFEFKDAAGVSPQIYGISTAVTPERGNYPPDKWFTKQGFAGKIITDDADGTGATAFGTSGYPFIVVLDGTNKVLWRGSGQRPKDQLVKEINGAFSGTTVAPVGTETATPAAG